MFCKSSKPGSRCVLLSMVASAILVISPIQAAEVPFAGALSGSAVDTRPGTAEDFYLNGAGTATHLGLCRGSFRTLVRPRRLFPLLETSSEDARTKFADLVSADNSKLEGMIRYDSYDPETLSAWATFTITSGTGRFQGTTGTIDVLFLFSDATLLDFDCLLDGRLDY